MLQLTDSEKQRLLDLARAALKEAVCSGRLSEVAEPAGALQTPCGAFVTLFEGTAAAGMHRPHRSDKTALHDSA